MHFVKQIIFIIILTIVFIFLSAVSLLVYRADNINQTATSDRLPIAEASIFKLSQIFIILENIPTIQLLPKISEETPVLLPPIVKYPIELAVTKEKNELPSLNITSEIIKNINFLEIKNRLKERLSRDWFRF